MDTEWITELDKLGRQIQFPTLRPESREALMTQFRSRKPTAESLGARVGRVMANLLFDSQQGLALSGARSGQDDARQLHFTSEATEILLDVKPLEQGATLNGQLLLNPDAPSRWGVQLVQNDREIGLAEADELGQFLFEDVVEGAYQLIVLGQGVEVVIPQVVV